MGFFSRILKKIRKKLKETKVKFWIAVIAINIVVFILFVVFVVLLIRVLKG